MSYTDFPSTTAAAAPGATDDNTKGYVVGSQWVDTSVTLMSDNANWWII